MYVLNINPLIKCLSQQYSKLVLIIAIILLPASSFALKNDIEKPVHINADSVSFNKSQGTAVYEGNVIISQGSLEIRAHKIKIIAPKSEIQTITATGSPVSFKQKMDDGKPAKGSANRFVYHVKTKHIVMDGNAKLTQNNDAFNSNHIEYSIHSGELKAGNAKNKGKSRVRAVFYPTNKTK